MSHMSGSRQPALLITTCFIRTLCPALYLFRSFSNFSFFHIELWPRVLACWEMSQFPQWPLYFCLYCLQSVCTVCCTAISPTLCSLCTTTHLGHTYTYLCCEGLSRISETIFTMMMIINTLHQMGKKDFYLISPVATYC